jgi:hypothetical protein
MDLLPFCLQVSHLKQEIQIQIQIEDYRLSTESLAPMEERGL